MGESQRGAFDIYIANSAIQGTALAFSRLNVFGSARLGRWEEIGSALRVAVEQLLLRGDLSSNVDFAEGAFQRWRSVLIFDHW